MEKVLLFIGNSSGGIAQKTQSPQMTVLIQPADQEKDGAGTEDEYIVRFNFLPVMNRGIGFLWFQAFFTEILPPF